MNFNEHFHIQGKHAFLSPSKYHWINYDDQKLEDTFMRHLAVERGVRLHALADECISLGVKLPRTSKTLNLYVNDAIGFKMKTEQVLYYSDNAFGTADAIVFKGKTLRIHDLKTGVTPTSMRQLEVYAAFFCLEYNKHPEDIDIELRIYQSDEVVVHNPPPEDITYIMSKIIQFDKSIETIKAEG